MSDFNSIFVSMLMVLWLYTGRWALIGEFENKARKKRKNEKNYPFFSYPLYKKIFLFGLKGTVSKLFLVFVCLGNISILVAAVASIWIFIKTNPIVVTIYQLSLTAFIVSETFESIYMRLNRHYISFD